MSFLNNTILKPLVSGLLQQYKLDRLGSVTSVDLDNSHRTLKVTLQLDGESTPIELEFQYAMAEETQIEITTVKSSRTWIATLVNEFVPAEKKRFAVPAMAARFL